MRWRLRLQERRVVWTCQATSTIRGGSARFSFSNRSRYHVVDPRCNDRQCVCHAGVAKKSACSRGLTPRGFALHMICWLRGGDDVWDTE